MNSEALRLLLANQQAIITALWIILHRTPGGHGAELDDLASQQTATRKMLKRLDADPT